MSVVAVNESTQTFLERIQALRLAPPDPDSEKWQAHYKEHLDNIKYDRENALYSISLAICSFLFFVIGFVFKSLNVFLLLILILLTAILAILAVFSPKIRRRFRRYEVEDWAAIEKLKIADREAFQKWKAKLNAIALEWATQEKREKGTLHYFLNLEEHLDFVRNTKLRDLLNDLKTSLKKNESEMLELEVKRDALINES